MAPPPSVLPGVYTRDSIGPVTEFDPPVAQAQGKSPAVSLLRPMDLARRLLPEETFRMLETFSNEGCAD